MGANVVVEFNWGHFFKLGAIGANVLVEFEKKNILTGGIFFIGGIFLSWGQKIILGSRKSAFLGIILTSAFLEQVVTQLGTKSLITTNSD